MTLTEASAADLPAFSWPQAPAVPSGEPRAASGEPEPTSTGAARDIESAPAGPPLFSAWNDHAPAHRRRRTAWAAIGAAAVVALAALAAPAAFGPRANETIRALFDSVSIEWPAASPVGDRGMAESDADPTERTAPMRPAETGDAEPPERGSATAGPGSAPGSAPGSVPAPGTSPARPSQTRAVLPASGRASAITTPTVVETRSAAPSPKPLNVGIEPAFSPSFSTRGSELYFHAGGERASRLMRAVLADDGSAPEVWRVLDDGSRNHHPRLSPDGRYVAFDSDRGGTRGVHILDLQRGIAWRASGDGYASAPAWSPDGRVLAFVREEPDREGVWNLWSLTIATGEMRRLTAHDRGQTWAASWLPDGRRICYSHEDRLIVLDLETGATKVFESPRPGRMVRTPAVSPDGRFVAYQVHGDGAWLLDLDRATTRRLLRDRTAEEFAWSPDGERLAFHSRRDGTWRVWLLSNPT
jgi:WD40 repeat protein